MDLNGIYVEILISCVFLSAFFSGSETALTSLSEAKTRQIIENHERGEKALRLWLSYPNRVLTTLLVCNNIVNVLSAAVATVLAEEHFGSYGIGIATGGMTFILLVFGEVTPKTFARHNAARVAPLVMIVLYPLHWILSPFVSLLTFFASLIVRLGGGKSSSTGPVATEEDIAFMIRLGSQEGVLARDEGRMLESVFEFHDTLVKEVMISRTNISALEQDVSYAEVITEIKKHNHSRWPVFQENLDNIVGVFHAKDLMKIEDDADSDFNIMSFVRPALFVPDMMPVRTLLKEFKRGKAHLAIVVDEYGGTAGMITLEDVLEEIVGEIRDEYDDADEEQLFRRIDTNNLHANGQASIYPLGEALEVDFPDEEHFETLAGFLISTYGKMPPPNTEIDYQGWRFMVKNSDEKKIESVLIRRLPVDTKNG